MPNPESGHGALFAVTLDPVVSPNVFTVIAQQTGTNAIGFTRETTKITPHNERMSRSITSNVIDRESIPLEGNYIHADTTHDGLRDLYIANTTIGIRLIGPSGAAGDAYILSGELTAYKIENPSGSGVRKFTAAFMPSGPMRIDGVLIS
jgi:hypothetical protein